MNPDNLAAVPPVSSHFSVAAYLLYLLVSVVLTVWVARTLQRNGAPFLREAFLGKDGLADWWRPCSRRPGSRMAGW
jgi:hypothetical protein